MTSRGEQTRERLLDVAEQLMSARGVEGVSLREIRLGAGQRNTSALQFHFGDRDGLLQALSGRHRPRIQANLHRRYARMMSEGLEHDGRTLISVLVGPVIDYVFEGPSERAGIRILAELGTRPELRVHDFVTNASPESLDVGRRLLDELEPIVTRQVGFERIFMVSLATIHLCADRARIEDASTAGRRHMSRSEFAQNVLDMAHGALFAPIAEPATLPRS